MNIPSFSNLKKYCKQTSDNHPQYKLAVLGDCATQHLASALRGYGAYAGLGLAVLDTDYNQIDAQVMDPGSELYAFEPNAVLIQMCTEKLYEAFCAVPLNRRASFAEDTYARILSIWEQLNSQTHTTVLQCNFPLMDDGTFGQFGNKTKDSFLYQQRKLNYLLMEGSQQV